jgi:excisionase family DNA binding protein
VNKNILDHEILTVKEVALYLRVSRVTVWRWCQNGILPARRIGRSWRINRDDLLQLLERPVSDPLDSLAVDDSVLGSQDN